jgi:hypothetical protein
MHRGGFCLPTPRHARHATLIGCNSGPASLAGESGCYGFNTPLAQWQLRARGRNWFEGRIADRPRLQHSKARHGLGLGSGLLFQGSGTHAAPRSATDFVEFRQCFDPISHLTCPSFVAKLGRNSAFKFGRVRAMLCEQQSTRKFDATS